MRSNTGKSQFSYDFMAILFITIIAGVIAFRNLLGFDWTDESFYLSMADRFYRGGAPIIQEWNPAQLFGIVLLPIYSLYYFIMGSTDYIYLFFRIVSLFIAYCISLLTYRAIRKIGYRSHIAMISGVIFLIYSRASIPTLSYYSVSMYAFMITILLMLEADFRVANKPVNFLLYFFSGVSYIVSVCANPFLSLIYIIGLIVIIICSSKTSILITRILASILGCVSSTIAILIFFISRSSIGEIWNNVGYILADPEHEKRNYILDIARWFNNIIKEYHFYTISIITVIFIYISYCRIKNKFISIRTKKWLFYLASFICLINIVQSIELIGLSYIALTIYGFLLFILTEKRSNVVFNYFFIPGIALSLAWKFCSNTGITTMTIGFVISAIASIIFLVDFLNENKDKFEYKLLSTKRTFGIIIYSLAIFAVGSTFYLRIFHVHRDAPLELLKYRIESGPAKGLYTTDYQVINYNEIISALDIINRTSKESDYILISKLLPWGYLYAKPNASAYTTWRVPMDSDLAIQYYKQNPEMLPDFIFLVGDKYGVTNDNNPPNGKLAQYLKLNNYKNIQLKCGVIFLK